MLAKHAPAVLDTFTSDSWVAIVNKTLDFRVFSNVSPTALSIARLANASAAAACTVYQE